MAKSPRSGDSGTPEAGRESARVCWRAKVEAARACFQESLTGALTADAALRSAAERQYIDDAAAHLSAVAQGDDVTTP